MKIFVSSVMQETWRERQQARDLFSQNGHEPVLKANYEKGPQAPLSVYRGEPTKDLILSSDTFLMILGLSYGLTAASGRSMAHEELILAQKHRKKGIAFGPSPDRRKDAEPAQHQLLERLEAYLGPAYRPYNSLVEFRDILSRILVDGVENHSLTLRPNRVFLCHATADIPKVEGIASALRKAGWEVFYDREHILVGDSLVKTIMLGEEESAYVGVLLSPRSVVSDWVRTEIEFALELEKRWGQKIILPIKLEEFQWPNDLQYLEDLKYADFTGSFDEGVRQLRVSLDNS